MSKSIIRYIALLLCLALTAAPVMAAADNLDRMIAETADALEELGNENGTLPDLAAKGSAIGDWTVIALALDGVEGDYEAYLNSLRGYVERTYAAEEKMDRVKATPYHRMTLAILALGGDPQAFGTKPDGTAIDLVADGTYHFWGDSIGAQGLNGWIYGLMALDASGAKVPADAKFTREDMISAIVSAQERDGGFGLVPGKSDVDVTAMALQALAPYRSEHLQVIDGALAYLSGVMNEDGTFTVYGEECAETSAQVLLALCALGIDPAEDSRFCRGEATILTGLAGFRLTDGSYGHLRGAEKANHLATAQTLLALTAVERLRNGEGWIYDFSDYAGPKQATKTDHIGLWIVLATVVAAAAVVVLYKRRK